jgi:thiosulfate/3-mercaptopyruvate sulfurtransferase
MGNHPGISPLITVDALARTIGDANLRIADVRWVLGSPGAGRAKYEDGHLPGAVHLDLDTDLADLSVAGGGRHPLPHPAELARILGRAGIGNDSFVVAYDDVGGWVAARLWWMLEMLGHRAVRVLDGGFGAWVAAGLPVRTEITRWPVARLDLAARWERTVDRDQVLASLGRSVILDARAGPRYRGETEPIDPVAGHIPTALNAPTEGNLGPDGRFLPPAALRRRFIGLGAGRPGGPAVITSCGSGVSALHNSLAMRIAGLPDPLLYVGSWSDWSSAGYPAATGPTPGDPPASR